MPSYAYKHNQKPSYKTPVETHPSPNIDDDEEFTLAMERKRCYSEARAKRLLESEQNFLANKAEIDGDFSRFEVTCPCGKHKGLRFYKRVAGEEVPISDVMCPLHVFTRRFRDEVRKGNGKAFGESYPKFAEQFVREA